MDSRLRLHGVRVDEGDRRPKALSTLVPASRARGSRAPRRIVIPHPSLPFGSPAATEEDAAVSSSGNVATSTLHHRRQRSLFHLRLDVRHRHFACDSDGRAIAAVGDDGA
nr:hypothetical protein Itr_chr12CG23060 [Ipomoea trifida]